MFAFLKSIFYSPPSAPLIRRKETYIYDLDFLNLNGTVAKYDYYFSNTRIRESSRFTRGNPQLYIGHDDLIITTSNNPKSGIYIKIWHPETLSLLYNYEGPSKKFLLSLPNLQILVGSGDDLEIIDIAPEGGTVINTLIGHTQGMISAILHPDGRIITNSHDSSIKVWTRESGECQLTLQHRHHTPLMIVSACGNKLITRCFDYSLRVWNLSNGICEREFFGEMDLDLSCGYEIYLSSVENTIICRTPSNIEIWNIETGNLKILSIYRYSSNIIVSEDKIMYIACDNSLQIYDLRINQVIETISNPLKPIWGLHVDNYNTTPKAIRLLPDQSILNLSKDNRLSIWNPVTKKYHVNACAHISRVEILSDGKVVFVSGGKLEIWN